MLYFAICNKCVGGVKHVLQTAVCYTFVTNRILCHTGSEISGARKHRHPFFDAEIRIERVMQNMACKHVLRIGFRV